MKRGQGKRQREVSRRNDLLLGLWDIDYCEIFKVKPMKLRPLKTMQDLVTYKLPNGAVMYDDRVNDVYDVLPEMIEPNRLYPIVGAMRKNILLRIKDGIRFTPWIVFYGGSASGINRRDVGSLRFICGDAMHVRMRLKEMEFRTWMDYRLYTMVIDEEVNWGRIGRRIDISVDMLTRLALFVPDRKKLAMLKKGRIAAANMDDTEAGKREMLKKYVDGKVSAVLSG
jgi:hypothetical protein